MYFIAAISLERWIAVRRPLHVASLLTYRKSCQIAFGLFIFVFILQIFPFFVLHPNGKTSAKYSDYQCNFGGQYRSSISDKLVTALFLYWMISFILVPYGSTFGLNAMILLEVSANLSTFQSFLLLTKYTGMFIRFEREQTT